MKEKQICVNICEKIYNIETEIPVSKEIFKEMVEHFVFNEYKNDFIIVSEVDTDVDFDTEITLCYDVIDEILEDFSTPIEDLLNVSMKESEIHRIKNNLTQEGKENLRKLLE